MGKKVSQFSKWFKAQFGRLPEDFRPTHEIEKDLKAAKEDVRRLEIELEWKKRIDTEYTAASYTRNAAEKKFKF